MVHSMGCSIVTIEGCNPGARLHAIPSRMASQISHEDALDRGLIF